MLSTISLSLSRASLGRTPPLAIAQEKPTLRDIRSVSQSGHSDLNEHTRLPRV